MHFAGYFVAVFIGFAAGAILGRKLAVSIIESKDRTITAIADAKRAVEAEFGKTVVRFQQVESDLRLQLKIATKAAPAPPTTLQTIETKVEGVIAGTEKEIAAKF